MTLHNVRHRRAVAAVNLRRQGNGINHRLDPTPTDSADLPDDTDHFGLPVAIPDNFPPPGAGGNPFADAGTTSIGPTSTPTPAVPTRIVPNLPTEATTSSPLVIVSSPTTVSTSTSTSTSALVSVSAQPPPPTTTSANPQVTPPVSFVTQPSTAIVTISSTNRPLAASSVTSSTSSATPTGTSSGVSTGVVVGGIGAGIVAVAVIGFAIAYFMRRARKQAPEDDSNLFNPRDFRRSAMLMPDDHAHEDMSRGFNPRPPTMIERRLASPAPTFGTQYGAPQGQAMYGDGSGGYSDNYAGYGQSGYPSHSPGQVMGNVQPHHPMMPPSAYGQSPFSPISPDSPNFGHYNGDPVYPGNSLMRQPSNGVELTRQNSGPSWEQHPQVGGSTAAVYHDFNQTSRSVSPSAQNAHSPTNIYSQNGPTQSQTDYLDLDRSSVSPFQAAQYAEISKQLNTEPPHTLAMSPQDDNYAGNPPVPSKDAVSPFADPEQQSWSLHQVSSPVIQNVNPISGNLSNATTRPTSSDSMAQGFEFPAPPPPISEFTSRYRVNSNPPKLPEFHLESRASVQSSFSSTQGHNHPTRQEPSPSPLSNNAVVVDSPPAAHFFGATPVAAQNNDLDHKDGSYHETAPTINPSAGHAIDSAPQHSHNQDTAEGGKRPNTVYDDLDAYGGI